MKTIWKFPITHESILMPEGAQILSAQMQSGLPYLWALVDPNKPKTNRYFRIIGTGHEIEDPESLRHIHTMQDGRLVWHVFEKS